MNKIECVTIGMNDHGLEINSLNIWYAALGLSLGTIWPAPFIIATVKPSYYVLHPKSES